MKHQGNPYYSANMQSLQRYYPYVARIIQKADDFHGKYDGMILQEIDDIFDSMKSLTAQLSVFLGFGLGNEVLRFMTKHAKRIDGVYILIIEKDVSLLKAAMKSRNLTELFQHKYVRFIVGEPIENLFSIFQAYLQQENKYMFLRSVKPIYGKESDDYYVEAWRTFKEAAKYTIMNYGNDPKDSLIGVENMLSNVNVIINNPGINLLKNQFTGKPAVVVSTGPSLDKNKHLLHGLEDKAVIIAADSALKPLLKIGIKPHLVTALEREKEIVQLVDGLTADEVKDVYLAACPVVYNEVYQAWPGKNIITYRNFDHFKWLKIDRGILDIKSSAGNMAFKVAEYLGCNPIILIGQDLALAGEKTNAENTPLGTEQVSYLREMRYKVKGNVEDEVTTTASLKLFLNSYIVDVAQYKGRCINSTEGGAYIEGTKVMPFAESIMRFIKEPFNPLEKIKSILDTFIPEEKAAENVLSIIDKTIDSFKKMSDLCSEGMKMYDDRAEEINQYVKEPDFEKMEKIMAPLLKIKNQVIGLDPSNFQLFYAHIAQAFYLNHELELCKQYDLLEPDTARAEILKRQREWFEIIDGVAKVCVQVLEKGREQIC